MKVDIKELRKSQHKPTIFQAGVQDFIDGLEDKLLKVAETWKNDYRQVSNTATLNGLFNDMLKKYKDSVDEGGHMTSTDLYSLYQINNNAQNCGSSSPPPPSSSQGSNKPKGPSMFSKLKNAVGTSKNNTNDPSASTPRVAKVKLTADERLKKHAEDMKNKKDADEEKEKLKAAKKTMRDERIAAGQGSLTDKVIKNTEELGAKGKATLVALKKSNIERAEKETAAKAAKKAENDARIAKGDLTSVEKLKNAAAARKGQLADVAKDVLTKTGDTITGVATAVGQKFEKATNKVVDKFAAAIAPKINPVAQELRDLSVPPAAAAADGSATPPSLPPPAAAKVAATVNYGDSNDPLRGSMRVMEGGSSSASHRRTRYISDIKNNRRRLYDREREIIQSIRNFENNNNNNNNNRHKSRHHKTRKLRNMLMRR
jgi:hypothetical protein